MTDKIDLYDSKLFSKGVPATSSKIQSRKENSDDTTIIY